MPKSNPADYEFEEYDVGPTFPKWQKKVLVTGVPGFDDWDLFAAKMDFMTTRFVKTALVTYPDDTPLNRMAVRWAADNEAPVVRFHLDPDWKEFAVDHRVASVARYADYLISFGKSTQSIALVDCFAYVKQSTRKIKVISIRGK